MIEQMLSAEELDAMVEETVYRALFGRGVSAVIDTLGLPSDAMTLLEINDYAFRALSETYANGLQVLKSIGVFTTYAQQVVFLNRMQSLAEQAGSRWRPEAARNGIKFLSLDKRSEYAS